MNTDLMKMTETLTFYFADEIPLTTMMIDGEPWFSGAEVCKAINIRNASQALSRLDEDEKDVCSLDTPGGRQEKLIVNESGFYALVIRAKAASTPGSVAYKFRKWVTSEVLPSIRKTGGYQMSGSGAGAEMVPLIVHQNLKIKFSEQKAELAEYKAEMAEERLEKSRAVDRAITEEFDSIWGFVLRAIGIVFQHTGLSDEEIVYEYRNIDSPYPLNEDDISRFRREWKKLLKERGMTVDENGKLVKAH